MVQNILLLYNATQTYTNTVYEHVANFGVYSNNRYFFLHQDDASVLNVDLGRFDAIGLHYSIRLPFNQVSDSTRRIFEGFDGLKFLFIQDEYDHTHRAWEWIKQLGFGLVFTVVPEEGVEKIYPKAEFPGVRFVSVLTGYVPTNLAADSDLIPPSRRPLWIGYRGRSLPIRYGQLAQEKVQIGSMVKAHCLRENIPCDIEWTEGSRIYGDAWDAFMKSCRATLGSESGSNVFDWSGDLQRRIAEFVGQHSNADEQTIYEAVIKPAEVPGLMNQVSPKIFEAIASRTVLILFEGAYSGVLQPDVHYISMKKDGSNLPEIIAALDDADLVDELAERAYQDIIASGMFGYARFVARVDEAILLHSGRKGVVVRDVATLSCQSTIQPSLLTTMPVRAVPVVAPNSIKLQPFVPKIKNILLDRLSPFWMAVPPNIRRPIAPTLKKILGIK